MAPKMTDMEASMPTTPREPAESQFGSDTDVEASLPKHVANADLENAMRKLESNTGNNYGYPLWRKCLIVFVTSWVTLAACFSSTSLFTAVDEIARDLNTTTVNINICNAGVLLAMGFSSMVWGPIGTVAGRRMSYNLCIIILFLCTIGTALAPNMRVFVAMRVLSGLSGTYFHVCGQAILAEYFPPIQRGTATGFFLAGTVLGPPLGPLVAGIIVTYKTWRLILWLQAAMVGTALVLSLPTIPFSPLHDTPAPRSTLTPRALLAHFSPLRVLSLFARPNILLTDLACGLLSYTQYTLLSAPRHLLTARFNLHTPLIAGLFYLSPATGFLAGTLIGGRYSDRTVRAHIAARGGVRVPQDRLWSGMWSFFLVVPASSLVYGWGLWAEVGGLALPVAAAFFTAAGLLAAFASLNTYCAEVLPRRRAAVIASKYLVQYSCSAAASAASVPMIEAVGVGVTSTVGVVFVLVGGVLTVVTARYGLEMQEWVEGRWGKGEGGEEE